MERKNMSAHSRSLDYQNFEAGIATEDLLTEFSFKSWKFSIQTVLDDIKAVVTVEQDFENWDISLLLAKFEFRDRKSFDARFFLKRFSNEIPLYKSMVIAWKLDD